MASPMKLLALLLFAFSVHAADTAERIFVNGKIVTVDERFRIVQALAIRGQRIVAAGANEEVLKLRGPSTAVEDLKGRTVIPGLIDNHAHFIRAPEHDELRFDGVTSRGEALRLLSERVRRAPAGEWIVVLGGWSEEQFTDDARGFPREELDQIAPNHPVIVQSIYNHSFLNTAALRAAGIGRDTPNPAGGTIERSADGEPSGVVRGPGGVAFVAAKIPLKDDDTWRANIRRYVAGLNAMGLTAWYDAGGRGVSSRHYDNYEYLAKRGELNARVFWTTIRQPANPAAVDEVLKEIASLKPFQGSDYFDLIGWGETLYLPAMTGLLRKDFVPRPDDMRQARRIMEAVARRGLMLNAHVETRSAIDAHLDEIEGLARELPIKNLRWTLSHLDQVSEAQLERMKKLGLYAGLHSRPLIQGALMHKVHGDLAWDMPPFRRVQDSGIVWGLGSDATAVTPSNPFYTLDFAVTGRMIGGRQVNRETISREQALIAHTRSNAWFIFQESNLGELRPGKYADLVVLDRDYLTIPAEQIRDIRPVLTMVGGRVVYSAPMQTH
jgi:predicted amidohydrolase YtcJ